MSSLMDDELLPINNDAIEREISRSYRDIAPAHCTFKIESFSQILKSNTVKNQYGFFKSSGYSWKVSVYPKGRNKGNEDYVSMYLEMVDTQTFVHIWEVYVNYKLFIYDHLKDKYYTIQDVDGKVRRFHNTKTEWGFDQILSLQTLIDPSKGYICDDSCVFGAEVFVIKHHSVIESLPLTNESNVNPCTCIWIIDKFSTIKDEETYSSKPAVIGGCTWSLYFHPNGYRDDKNESLSVFLKADWVKQYPKLRLFTKFKLRIKKQLKRNDYVEQTCDVCFSASNPCWGYGNFISLKDLNNPSKGFLVNDSIILELEFKTLSLFKN